MSFHSPSFDRLTDLAQLGQQGAQHFELFGPATSPQPGELLLASPDAAITADHHYRAALPAVSVYALPGHVLGSAGLLLREGSVFWRGDVLPTYFRDAFQLGAAMPAQWLHGMRWRDAETLKIDEPLAVATHPNAEYGHFLLEMLPRLYLLGLLRDMGQPFRLALSTQTPAWMEPYVALYFAPREIVRYDSSRQLVRAPTFIVPAMLNVDYYWHPAMNLAVADVLARVRAQTPSTQQSGASLVYLSRRRNQDGPCAGTIDEAIEAVLAELGFVVVPADNMCMRERVEICANATCLVSESGHGAHAAVFAPRGCKLVIINPSGRIEQRIAALRGHNLALIEPAGGYRLNGAGAPEQNKPLTVDPDALRRVLGRTMEALQRETIPAYSIRGAPRPAPDAVVARHYVGSVSNGHDITTRQPEGKIIGMFEQAHAIVNEAERFADHGSANDVIHQLRKLCLSDFSDLLAVLPQAHLPNISAKLPRMASPEVQQSWTGGSGSGMSQATLDFVRIVEYHYTGICQRPLTHAKILDYGCGYGRLMRPFYYFTNPDRIFGVDPWDKSIEVCVQDGVLGQLRQSDFVPEILPVDDEKFDLIYSFSVFTHTSLHATNAALDAIRKCISQSGLLVLTTRPLEYWSLPSHIGREGFDVGKITSSHNTTGFSHFPSNWNLPADGISIFGDTSFTQEWCRRTFPSWNVQSYDRGLDPMQMILLLTPR